MTELGRYAWHAPYDNPDSSLSMRLSRVQDQIRAALDSAPPGPFHVISMCAGQGRDIIGVLADHPRRADVTARLVECPFTGFRELVLVPQPATFAR